MNHGAHDDHCSSHAPAPPAAIVPGAVWTCPMHPQIRRNGPGTCPICGMALEPLEPSLDDGPNPELVDFTRRLWVAGVLSVPLLAVSMVSEMLGIHLVSPMASPWIQLALTAPMVLWAGLPFFERGWTSLRTRHYNMFTLIAIGVGAAFLYSLVATLAPGLFPPSFRAHGMAVPVYYEAAGVVVAFVLLGQVLELRARAATGRAIRALLDLAPKTARRIAADGSEAEIPLADVAVGDHLRVRPGEAIPRRRDGARGALAGRRIDAYRRAGAGAQAGQGAGDRRHRQRHRQPAHRSARGGRRHRARADRPDGGGGAAQPRADPDDHRPRLGMVRAAGGAGRAGDPSSCGISWVPSRASAMRCSTRSRC